MSESDDAFAAEAEVPGFGDRDLQINLELRRLTISGKKETTEEQKKGKAIYKAPVDCRFRNEKEKTHENRFAITTRCYGRTRLGT